jgi:P4 family phage/plasmid primase-like protien
MNKKATPFLNFFPGHVYRYIDQTGAGRRPVSSVEKRDDLNLEGYEAYFTVNGFKDAPNAQKENCSSLNAFFVDIDGRKDLEELEAIKGKLDPTFILETKNGHHIYWVLDEIIHKDELSKEEWELAVARWEKIEQSIVTELKADPVVKDLTRIMRQPNTFYWKKSGGAYIDGTDGVFKIKGIYKNEANTYSMAQVEEVFPVKEQPLTLSSNSATTPNSENTKKMSELERKNFFDRVNEAYPIEERDSFMALLSGRSGTLPHPNCRNHALLITGSLARQAGWSKDKFLKHIEKTGWHGIEKERGGAQEIMSTVNSAFNGSYTYSYKNEIIAHNMTEEEQMKIQQAYTGVLKERKEHDKVRFSNYEREILARHPFLKKNEIGIVFDYKDGFYQMLTDQQVSDLVLNSLYDDMLWGYRTKRNVSDKVACLISIIPDLVISDDKGCIINVKNGLLDIFAKKLIPHTPEFVSLIQYPVVYDPEAKAPTWEACLKDWMAGPECEEKTRLLKQFSGYVLSSSMFYDRALFMVGDGGNGKSTFIDTIAMVIGPQATAHIDLEGLYGQFGMQGLVGKRLNIIEEVAGNYYQSNKLKKLISGEQVTIDIKYKPQFTFRPQAKFVFSVNLLPRVDDTSTATERRICAVTFRNNYRKNPNFKLRSSMGLLAQELSGILNWMIEGAQDLAREGNFIITEEQTQMLNEYREENSSVEGFLSECVMLDPESSVDVPDLYAEYKKWSQSDGGRKVKANITFTKEVKAYGAKNDRFGFRPRQHGSDEAKFVGIKLNPLWTKQSGGGPQQGGFGDFTRD